MTEGLMNTQRLLILLFALLAWGCSTPAPDDASTDATGEGTDSESKVVNVYSARHYDTDDSLYARFTEQTGIEVNVIEGDSAALLERLRREGEQSPADIFIAVDAGRLHHADSEGIFTPASSETLTSRIPAHLRHPAGHWFGLTKRARVIMYATDRVQPDEITTYEELADPKWKGRLLIRSSSNIYNQSLVGSILAAHGEEAAEEWCRGVVANMARTPQGGDSDQIRALAAGEGDIAVANTYYLAKMIANADKPEDQESASKVGVIFPNQGDDDRGAHVNLSGAGLVKGGPNPENAVQFLEFLTNEESQAIFAGDNKEYPTVGGYALVDELQGFGEFKEDSLNASTFGANNQEALQLMDRCGWR